MILPVTVHQEILKSSDFLQKFDALFEIFVY